MVGSGAGILKRCIHTLLAGGKHSDAKPKQHGSGGGSYRAFVSAEMKANGGNLKAAATKWKAQKGSGAKARYHPSDL